MLVIAERGEVSVVARPVERVAERRDHAQSDESGTEPVHLGKQRVLQSREDSAGNDESPHTVLTAIGTMMGSHDEPAGENQGDRHEHPWKGHARLEQIDGKERGTARERDGWMP